MNWLKMTGVPARSPPSLGQCRRSDVGIETNRDIEGLSDQTGNGYTRPSGFGGSRDPAPIGVVAAQLDRSKRADSYGGQILPYVNEKERCPLLMHFGKRDPSIPLADVEALREAHPEAEIHVYDADHGFNCDRRGSFDEAASALARERTMAFFGRLLA